MSVENNKENIWLSLFINIVIPAIILLKLEKWLIAGGLLEAETLNPVWFFCVALAFPIVYGIWDIVVRKKWSIFAIIGVLNVLIMGVIGVFQLSRNWVIAKEAGIPMLLGLIVLGSVFTSKPLIKLFIYRDALLDVAKIDNIINERGETLRFTKIMKQATLIFSSSFFASSIIQFFLAASIFTEGASASEFNEQVGKMTWVSYIVVMAPSMALMFAAMIFVFKKMGKLTGLKFEELLAKQS